MSMSDSRRRRASWLVLLGMAAGLALGAATAASASAAHEMACCPAEAADPCAWLGAADCCPERPAAPAPASPNGAPPDAATASPLAPVPPVLGATAPPRAGTASNPKLSRSEVLRL
jgi:hypothetical protein